MFMRYIQTVTHDNSNFAFFIIFSAFNRLKFKIFEEIFDIYFEHYNLYSIN